MSGGGAAARAGPAAAASRTGAPRAGWLGLSLAASGAIGVLVLRHGRAARPRLAGGVLTPPTLARCVALERRPPGRR